jgi:tetratricopeptide (TPR) repeat protein
MVRSQAPLPEGITRSISHGRFAEAADALRTLVQREPSVAVLVALADMTFQLGELTEAKANALKAVEADPREHSARVLLARVRTALDEREAALADFRAALELARPAMAPVGRSLFPRTRRCTISSSSSIWSRPTISRPARCCRCPPA